MKKPVIPGTASISTLVKWTGIPSQSLRDILQAAGKPSTGNVDIGSTMRTLLANYAKRSNSTKEKAAIIELQNAEVKQLAGLRKLAFLDDCTAYVQEERIAFRQCVMHATFLNDSQKKRILEKCKAIKTTKPEPVES